MNPTYSYTHETVMANEAAFFRRVYNWMIAGLALTGGVAWFTAHSPALLNAIFGGPLLWVLIIGELGMVFFLAARIHKISAGTASFLFIAYSVLNGLTLSAIFLVYTKESIASAFFVSAGTFAAMSVYGYTTKRSLASMGGFLMMGLFGIIIASVVNIFLHSSMIYWIVTYAGVLVFTGLTAYDTQKLKMIAQGGFANEAMESKSAIMGALSLYLDFVNLFLMILRIFGGGRD